MVVEGFGGFVLPWYFDFPSNTPMLPVSLHANGKSRTDLWAFEVIESVSSIYSSMPRIDAAHQAETLTEEEYETLAKDAFRVHLAGKGNFPKPNQDMTEYERFYMKNYSNYQCFEQQEKVFEELKTNASKDFDQLLDLLKREAKKAELIFTFDGDDWQDNSPFTHGIAHLIKKKCNVYAFKKSEPKTKHVESWAFSPYKALVLLGEEPKTYTPFQCDAYLSYGFPLMSEIKQPQRDKEVEEVENGKYKDKFSRPMIDDSDGQVVIKDTSSKPGLVQSSMLAEYKKLQGTFADERPSLFEKRALLLIKSKPNKCDLTCLLL